MGMCSLWLIRVARTPIAKLGQRRSAPSLTVMCFLLATARCTANLIMMLVSGIHVDVTLEVIVNACAMPLLCMQKLAWMLVSALTGEPQTFVRSTVTTSTPIRRLAWRAPIITLLIN